MTSSNAELHRRRGAAIARGVSNSLAVYAQRARNAELWDVQGTRYIDFASGISVLNTGHLHPRVVAAVEHQLHELAHACFQVTPYELYVQLAERLNAAAPGPAPKKSILFSTGAEAVENAVKIARYHTRRAALIAFGGAFHGRTLAALALTGKVQPYKAGFGPLLPEVFHVPFPMAYHGIGTADALAGIERLFRSEVDPLEVAAILIEPVLGEGGFYVAPFELLRALRTLCNAHGIVLIADEIQSGFARTGRMFAVEHAGVEPDLITVAKSLAGGLPLSAVIGKAAIMDAPPPGSLGGTFAGSPLACAAALAVLDVIREERLEERASGPGRAGARAAAAAAEPLRPHRRGARPGRDARDRAGEGRQRRAARPRAHARAGAGGRPPRPGDPRLRPVRQRRAPARATDDQRGAAGRRPGSAGSGARGGCAACRQAPSRARRAPRSRPSARGSTRSRRPAGR